MLNLFPGVERVDRRVGGAEAAARRAVELAGVAGRRGTFGVGGLLMRSDGRIIAEAVNRVIDGGEVDDPTAHVERQLVDWYLDARHSGFDLPPEELVLVSSLDPCAMCAASIMSAGMTAIAVAEDPASGVHKCGVPSLVPPSLRARAQRQLKLFASPCRDTAALQGAWGEPISPSLVDEAEQAFTGSLTAVRRLIAKTDDVETGCDAIAQLCGDAHLAGLLGTNVSLGAREPQTTARPSSLDRSTLVDREGAVLLTVTAASGAPTRSSIPEMIRTYGVLRRYARRVIPAAGLPHQRTCAIVTEGSGFDDLGAMLALGAVGSALEDRPFANTRPVLGLVDREMATRFAATLGFLPPLYNEMLTISTGHVAAIDRHERGRDRSRQYAR